MLLRQLAAAIARSGGVRSTCTSFSAAAKVAASTSGPTAGAVANAGGVPAAGGVPPAGGVPAAAVGCWPAVVVPATGAVLPAAAVAIPAAVGAGVAAVAVPATAAAVTVAEPATAAEVRRKSRREVGMLGLPLRVPLRVPLDVSLDASLGLPLWQLRNGDDGQTAMARDVYGSYAENDIVL